MGMEALGGRPGQPTFEGVRSMQFCDCGELLLLAVEDTTVILLSGQRIPFRRATDYVACQKCLAGYPIVTIRRQAAMAGRGHLAS